MAAKTILLFGSIHHPVMSVLYHYLRDRERRRVIYLANETFPNQPGFFYRVSKDGQNGRLYLEDGSSSVDWDDVASTVLDGFWVQPPGLDAYSENDREYLQTESWAALIGMFQGLAQRGPVANFLTRRDTFNSRLATLAHLARHRLPIPPLCITSDADAAQEFIGQHRRVVFRPLSGRDTPFQEWNPIQSARSDRLNLSPVHFEARLAGEQVQLMKVGERWLTTSEVPPDEILEGLDAATDELGLHLAEAYVTCQDGTWSCLDLKPFLGPAIFANPDTAELLAQFLEGE